MYGDFGISEAFAKADNILGTAAKGIAEIITVPGYVNVDFSDVETVMRQSGLAVMGTGLAEGNNRATEAVEKALNSPLLNNNDIRGSKNILINITSCNQEVTMDEVGKITDFVQNKAGFDADIIWGNGKDETLENNISVTIVATGFGASGISEYAGQKKVEFIPVVEKLEAKIPQPREHIKQQDYIKKQPKSNDQKIIEFDISKEKKKEDEDFAALYPKTIKERTNKSKLLDCSLMSDEDVDEWESVPAYKRRQLRMNDPKYKKSRSDYKVNKNNDLEEGRNKYIHDNVD